MDKGQAKLKTEKSEKLEWRVHTPNLLKEIGNNNSIDIMSKPLMIFRSLLCQVAERAVIMNDLELNKLMIRLTMYSVADPESADYDPKVIDEYL